MKTLGRIAVIAVVPLLAGCFEAKQMLVVAPDGTSTVNFEVAVAPARQILEMVLPPEQLAAIPEAQLEAMIADMEADRDEDQICAPDADDVPETFTVEVETFVREEDGYEVCRATMVGPIADLGEFINEEGETTVLFTDEGGGVYTFFFSLPVPENGGEALIDPETDAMIFATMQGNFLTISITAPRIIETTGELDGNTATYQVPAQAILGQPQEAYEFTVTFALN